MGKTRSKRRGEATCKIGVNGRHRSETAKQRMEERQKKKGRRLCFAQTTVSACQKGLAEFAARRRQKNEIIFSRDMCVRENTAQAASVEFRRFTSKLCAQQTVSLLSDKTGGFFRQFQAAACVLRRRRHI